MPNNAQGLFWPALSPRPAEPSLLTKHEGQLEDTFPWALISELVKPHRSPPPRRSPSEHMKACSRRPEVSAAGNHRRGFR